MEPQTFRFTDEAADYIAQTFRTGPHTAMAVVKTATVYGSADPGQGYSVTFDETSRVITVSATSADNF